MCSILTLGTAFAHLCRKCIVEACDISAIHLTAHSGLQAEERKKKDEEAAAAAEASKDDESDDIDDLEEAGAKDSDLDSDAAAADAGGDAAKDEL